MFSSSGRLCVHAVCMICFSYIYASSLPGGRSTSFHLVKANPFNLFLAIYTDSDQRVFNLFQHNLNSLTFVTSKTHVLTLWRLMTYIFRTAPLTSRRCILHIWSTNIRTEYFKQAAHSPFFSLQNAVCFIMLPFLVLYNSHFTYRVC
jgi:hypothetical protein